MIDLHGYTIQEAFELVKEKLYSAYENERKTLKFITGRSGRIKYEFDFWLENSIYVRTWHTDNKGGLYVVKLKKKPKPNARKTNK